MKKGSFSLISKICISTMMTLFFIPLVSLATMWMPSQLTYDAVTGRVYGTVYSDQTQLTLTGPGFETLHIGTFQSNGIAYGTYANNYPVNVFNIDTVTALNYKPSNIYSGDGFLMLKYNPNATTVYEYTSLDGVLKDIDISLQVGESYKNMIYTGLNNKPYTTSISISGYWGNPFVPGWTYSGGGIEQSECTMTSSNTDVVTIAVNNTGLTAIAPGSSTITASCENITKSKVITVNKGYIADVFPDFAPSYSIGTYPLSTIMYDVNYKWYDVTQLASYSSSNNSVVSIDPVNKKIKALSIGLAFVTTTYEQFTTISPVYVVGPYTPNLYSISFSKELIRQANQGIVAGTTIYPNVTANYSNTSNGTTTQDVTQLTTFKLVDNSAGLVNSDHSITLTKPGDVQFIAFYGNQYRSLTVKVLPSDQEPGSEGNEGDGGSHHNNGSGGGASSPPDTQPPTWPTGSKLTASNISNNGATLTWSAAVDNDAVTSYRIYNGSQLIDSVTGNTYTYPMTNLQAATQYTFKVEAGDAAANWTTNGPSVVVQTAALPQTTTGSHGGGGGGGFYLPPTIDTPVSPIAPADQGGTDAMGTAKLYGPSKKFADVKESYTWAAEAIDALAEKGIIQGTSAVTFEPANKIRRADVITLLVRAFNLKADFHSNFSDIHPDDYYYQALGIARELGILTGVGGNLAEPRQDITRQDLMVLCARVLKASGKLEADGSVTILDAFKDNSSIAAYAKDSVAEMVQMGIIEGDDRGINPLGSATRAETAVILSRLLNKLH